MPCERELFGAQRREMQNKIPYIRIKKSLSMFCHREGFFAGFRRENTVRLFFAFRKCNEHYRAGFRAIFDSDGTAVKRGNFPYERKPETHSAVLSAARLVNTEKRLEILSLYCSGIP